MEEPASRNVQDEDRLAQLGYKQELKRDWTMMHNFGVSFSIIVSRVIDDVFAPCLEASMNTA